MYNNLYLLQYQLEVDKCAHQRWWAPEFELQDFFGQILHFLIIIMPASPDHWVTADSFIYAAIKQAKITEPATNHCRINFYEELGPGELVDLNWVKYVVGHILYHGKWAVIDRTGSLVLAHTWIKYVYESNAMKFMLGWLCTSERFFATDL